MNTKQLIEIINNFLKIEKIGQLISVRQILNNCSKKDFSKLLPDVKIPKECLVPVKYPHALPESYCSLGIIT